jgi:hypothetical protein
MRSKLKISITRFILALSFLSLFCCTPKVTVNDFFTKKYSKEVKAIGAERAVPKNLKKEVTASPLPTKEEVSKDADSVKNPYPYVNIVHFGTQAKVGGIRSPSNEVYEQTTSAPAPSSGVFELGYNTATHLPFRRAGVEFDDITTPSHDVYGVRTEMSDKSYLFPGNASLTKNINKITTDQTSDDIQNSETIIKEQRLLKRKQKMLKIFGSDFVEFASLEKSETKDKEDAKADTAKKSDAASSKQNQPSAPNTIKNPS